VGALRALFGLFSYLFHSVLVLFLLGTSCVALMAHQELHLGMLPWTGSQLTEIVLVGSLFGLLTLILALGGRLRILFFLWALAIAVLAVKGYVFSPYHLGPGEIRTAGYVILGSLVALPGAWSQMFRKRRRDTRY